MATVSVIYPSGSSFDLDYYLETHMPLVSKIWGPCGLTSYDIVQYESGQPFQVQAILKWDSIESFKKAPSEEILADIPKFTPAQPYIVPGDSKAVLTL